MNPVIQYFTGEKSESWLFLVVGIAGLALVFYFLLVLKTSFWKGLAIPFLLVSILEVLVGVTLIDRSPKDIVRVEHYLKNEPMKIRTDEIPRMKRVMRNFVIFRYAEIVLILAGAALYLSMGKNDFWKGLGIGLFLQASIILTLDYFAERRGIDFLKYLNSISNEQSSTP